MTPLLETQRLRLRGPGVGDTARIAGLLDNFAVSGNLSVVPYPYTMEDARQWLGKWRADAAPAETRFIIDLEDEGAVGVIAFRNVDGKAEIGYWLGQPFWGRGIMTEAASKVIDWYFKVADADLIVSGVFHFNMASLAIQQKLGFVETGRSSKHSLARGEDVEHIETELTRDAFVTLDEKLRPNR